MSNTGSSSPPPPYSFVNSSSVEIEAPQKSVPQFDNPHPITNPSFAQTYSSQNAPPPTNSMNQQQFFNPTRLVVARTAIFGPFPVQMDCPYCRAHIVTHTSRVPGILSWIIFGVCFIVGFFLLIPWCLCCLPFCIDSCLDVVHMCPGCKRIVGRFSRL